MVVEYEGIETAHATALGKTPSKSAAVQKAGATMSLWQNYIRPKNLSQAMTAFATAPRPLLPIAGGTDILLLKV